MKLVEEPTAAVMAPVATIAPLGQLVSAPAAAIFLALQVGKSFPSALRP